MNTRALIILVLPTVLLPLLTGCSHAAPPVSPLAMPPGIIVAAGPSDAEHVLILECEIGNHKFGPRKWYFRESKAGEWWPTPDHGYEVACAHHIDGSSIASINPTELFIHEADSVTIKVSYSFRKHGKLDKEVEVEELITIPFYTHVSGKAGDVTYRATWEHKDSAEPVHAAD